MGQPIEGEIEARDATTNVHKPIGHMHAASSMGEENDIRYTPSA